LITTEQQSTWMASGLE